MWRTLLAAGLLVLAGCTTTAPGTADSATTAPDRAMTDAAPDRTNPWGESTLTVAINDSSNSSREFEPLVRSSLEFWANNTTRYVGYPLEFELDRDADDPDVVVRFVDRIESCANVTGAAGCAPFVTDSSHVSRPVSVDVVDSYSNASTRLILKHELGHVLGLNHSAEPQSVMAPTSQLETLPRTNATERRLPWDDPNFTVHVDDGGDPAVREQVRHALDYYADGADGAVPANVTYEFVDNRTEAEVVVNVSDELPCREGSGSCGRVQGIDPDGDDALERYDELRVTLSGVDDDAVGWHVGYWLGYSFGFETESEWPEPFRDATYEDRRTEWWE